MKTQNIAYTSISRKINSRITQFIIIISLFSLLFDSCIEDKVQPLYLGSIQGAVITKQLGTPLQGVEVNTAPATNVVFTDAEGKFQINNVPEGEYTVIFQIDNYARESLKIKVVRNSATVINAQLINSTILAPAPGNPIPTSGSINQPLSLTLHWQVNQNDEEAFRYTIKIFEASEIDPTIEIKNHQDTLLQVANLKYNTTYYWQVDVVSSTNYVTSGELWLFKTIPFPANRITFTSTVDGNYEVYSIDPNGESLARITETTFHELSPQFSSNRELIAYSANQNIDYHLYTVNKDGSSTKKITTLPIAGHHSKGVGFTWSPDNGKFIYSHYDKLYRIDKDGVNLTLIANAPANRNFRAIDWTPVGNRLVVETVSPLIFDSEIYIMKADGTDSVRMVDNSPGIIEHPSFSVDGTEIMFTRDLSGYESSDGRQLDASIMIMNIDTKATINVSTGKPDGTNDLQPRFSPDGAKIIFVNVPNDGTGVKSIWIMDRDGGNRVMLFSNGEMPHWK